MYTGNVYNPVYTTLLLLPHFKNKVYWIFLSKISIRRNSVCHRTSDRSVYQLFSIFVSSPFTLLMQSVFNMDCTISVTRLSSIEHCSKWKCLKSSKASRLLLSIRAKRVPTNLASDKLQTNWFSEIASIPNGN